MNRPPTPPTRLNVGVPATDEPPDQSSDEPLTEAGWPRPIVDGWPVPWVSSSDDLSNMDEGRRTAVVDCQLCQVCGLGHEPGARVFFCVNLSASDVEASAPDAVALLADDAAMHERCARLALARCPALVRQRESGVLVLLSAPSEEVYRLEDYGPRPCLGVWVRDARVERDYSVDPSGVVT